MSNPPSSASPSPGILLVDDDPLIGELINDYLEGHGFRVATAANGMQMRQRLEGGSFELVLLDLGLPGEDGLTLVRWLRERWHGAIIIVTGRGEAVDRVVGLELGADDYVSKPFDLRELLARVRAVLRRAQVSAAAGPPPVFTWAGYRLDTKARRLRRVDGEDVPLTTGEYELLLAFVSSPHKVQSRDELLNVTHGRDAGPYDKTIDVQVGRLRRKIERDAAEPELIKAVRGAGYVWTADVLREVSSG